jgi:hypothetical protein
MKAIFYLACAAGLASASGLRAQRPDSASAADSAARAAVHPVNVTGYVTTSYTYSTNAKHDTIVGRLYARRQSEFMLNVANVTLERVAATDRMSAGFHFEGWFGQNAAVVKSTGLDLGSNADIWQGFTVLNFPLSGTGRYLQLKAGKMATLLGVEVGEDVLNPNLGIGSQDTFLEPFTETGVELDAKLSSHVDVELRVSNGWDQVTDLNTGKTIMVRLGLTPDDQTLIAFTGYVGPEQSNNTRNQRLGANALISRKTTSASNVSMQLDYGQEDGAGSAGGQAKWYAAGVWVTYDVDPAATLALRADYMNDRDGARTSGVLGFPANAGQQLGSVTATLNVKSWDHALVRPEIRYDHSSLSVFNASGAQLSFGVGFSYLY